MLARSKALLRAASGLVWGNTLSNHGSRNLTYEVACQIIDIKRKGTAVSVALIAKDKRFTQGARSLEISTCIVEPYSVSKLESSRRLLLPRSEADVSLPGIDVWVVNLCSAGIPDLERFLDLLISNQEADMPKSNDGRVDRSIARGKRPGLA